MDCCFCGKPVEYILNGNDPRPIKITGEETPICCNECNARIVIPTRLNTWFGDEIKVLNKALELACLAISKAMCPNGDWENLKMDFANSYIEQAKEMMKSE